MSDTLGETGAAARIGGGKPWLVLKPNCGQTYDMDTRKCGWYGGETPSQGDEWAGQLGDIVFCILQTPCTSTPARCLSCNTTSVVTVLYHHCILCPAS